MHIYLAKSSRFESTDFASVMIDDVGCSRRHQCPQCDILQKKTPKLVTKILATKFGFVPDWSKASHAIHMRAISQDVP